MKFPWLTRLALLGLTSSLASGCIMYRLEELRNATPTGTPYQTELSRLYMEFAAGEEAAYDWRDSWYFADKGLLLAYGNDVGPEELDQWDLPDEGRDELQKARIRVVEVLTPELKKNDPQRAAQVQFYFDCWIENQEENWQNDEISACRDGLMRALGEGRSASAPVKAKNISKPVAKKDMVKEAAPSPAPEKVVPEKVAEKAAEAEKPAAPKEEKPAEAKKLPEKVPFGKPTPAPQNSGKKAAEKAAEKPEAAKVPTAETSSYAVFFEQKKADISTPGKNVLAEVVQLLKDKSDYAVILHVAGTPEDKELTNKRLKVVRAALAEGGVNESAVFDEAMPEKAKPVTRRVELFLNE